MAAQEDLVRAAIATGVSNGRVLEAVRGVPRESFVPSEFATEAHIDAPVPISREQVTSQPSLIARMVEALQLAGEERVLEIGSGYGYQTALLAWLAATVVSIERWEELAERARDNLARRGIENAHIIAGDGTRGVPEYAPYDAVIVSAAFPEVPEPLVRQLRPGGRLVQPLGAGGAETVVLFDATTGGLIRRAEVSPAAFVPLYGQYGYPRDDGDQR